MSAPEQQQPAAPPQDPSSSVPGGGLGLPPAFTQDPAAFLSQAAGEAGTRANRSKLAGPVAKFISTSNEEVCTAVSPLYLQAAAKQLAGDSKLGDIEQEMVRAKEHYEILEVRIIRYYLFVYIASQPDAPA